MVIIVHTLQDITSPQTASDVRLFPDNTKNQYSKSKEHL